MLNNRQTELLKIIVENYIKTARPVSSKAICDNLDCSSATIRNEMADLEDIGYLEKHIYLLEEFLVKKDIAIMLITLWNQKN